jgi:hypothetical protein
LNDDPVQFMSLYCPHLPFDCIVLDACTQKPVFDSVLIRSGDNDAPADQNVIVILHFSPEKQDLDRHYFESIGMVSANTSDGTSKLSRIFPSDDPFILFMRDLPLAQNNEVYDNVTS